MMEDRYAELRAKGMGEKDAASAAMTEFGSLEEVRESPGLGAQPAALIRSPRASVPPRRASGLRTAVARPASRPRRPRASIGVDFGFRPVIQEHPGNLRFL